MRLEILKVEIAADVGDVQSERSIETTNCRLDGRLLMSRLNKAGVEIRWEVGMSVEVTNVGAESKITVGCRRELTRGWWG